MAVTAIPNTGSQVDRAIVAWLISEGAGTSANTFTVHRNIAKVLPCNVVRTQTGTHQQESGGEVFSVSITCKSKAVAQAGESDRRKAIDNQVGLVMAAMMQTDDNYQTLDFTAAGITAAGRALASSDPTNNADMANFTCQNVLYMGSVRGEPDDDAMAWVEIRNFQITACNSVIS